ncbi:Dolichyl-diphosphooligosaccharide-protein glycosyltransferase subunit [Globisporangium polare]
MAMARKTLALVALFFMAQADAEVINTSVKRVLDLTKHVVRVQTDIQFVDADADTTEYVFGIPKEQEQHLAQLAAKCGKTPCEVVAATHVDANAHPDVAQYTVVLKDSVAKGAVGHIKLTSYFTHVLTPFPAEIAQKEEQLVVYEDSHVLISPYKTETQTTKVKLPSGRVESFSEIAPVARKGSAITYGPYANVEPFSGEGKSLRVHFKNHSPFLTVTNLVRELEVSMWGRVSVEEVYDLLHTGAKLKGGFSRYDYTAQNERGASFHDMHATLPKDAVNVYYRDQIGNVSTSRLRMTSTRQELAFQSRFPLFGGWKTQWYLGYSVPTHSVLARDGEKFKLEMDFSTSIDGAAVDDLTVKVILPEGATNVQVNLPFAVDSLSDATRQTYLDTPLVGRPVLIISKKNVIAAHNVPFEVTFDFPQTFMLHEPLLLVGGFLVFFVICMLLFRLDMSLISSSKKSDANKKKTE